MANAHLRGAEPAVQAICMLGPGQLRGGGGGIEFAIQLSWLRLSAGSLAVAPTVSVGLVLGAPEVQSGAMMQLGGFKITMYRSVDSPPLGHSSVMVAGLIRHPGQMASITCRWSGKTWSRTGISMYMLIPQSSLEQSRSVAGKGRRISRDGAVPGRGATVFSLASSSSETVGWEKRHMV